MICLSRPYSFKLFKGYLPQILLGLFLNTLPQMAQLKKATQFFVFMEGAQLPHNQVLVRKDRTFHRKVRSKLYRISKFNILENFSSVLSTT